MGAVRAPKRQHTAILRPDAAGSSSPEVDEALVLLLRRRYARYASTADTIRAELDQALGTRSLTQQLRDVRGG